MDATIEGFGKLYPAYATLYFKDECEIVETAPKSAMPRNRLWEHYCACRLSLAFYSLFLNGNTMV